MSRRLWVLPAVVALAIGASGTAAHAATTLSGTVGPGFTITLKKGSSKVRSLRAGSYTIRITDRGTIHNFHLTGPGVNKRTSVPGTGTTTWHVRLRRGTYRYVCDPHAMMMKGSFTVR
jgi:Copper binding proteins, plastocyanin/azurin family